MDLQQEQLARSLGDGHRVIHGVAGSGKTMILGYRAELLAKAATQAKPVLVLCYNEPLAVKLAADVLSPEDKDDDGIPLLRPISCGRDGRAPTIIRLPSLPNEAERIAELFASAHQEGHAWSDMAIICRRYAVMEACAAALRRLRLPHQVRKGTGRFDPGADTIKILTMHASKGLEFPLVALPGVGTMPEPGESEADEARLFYVAATRATEALYITLSGSGAYMNRFPA